MPRCVLLVSSLNNDHVIKIDGYSSGINLQDIIIGTVFAWADT